MSEQILTILSEFKRLDSSGTSRRWLICKCDCGNTIEIRKAKFTKGQLSCGCLKYGGKLGKVYNIDRKQDPIMYQRWLAMVRRADTTNGIYSLISICSEWRVYSVFRLWALENGYAEDLQIDRIDNDGDYRPSNCQYVDRSTNVAKGNLIRKNNSSGYRGLTIRENGNFSVKVKFKGITYYGGTFKDAKEAAMKYDRLVIDNGLPNTLNFGGISCSRV